jgi:hypothetical protein
MMIHEHDNDDHYDDHDNDNHDDVYVCIHTYINI